MDEEYTSSGVQASRVVPKNLLLENVSPATRLLEKRRQMFEVQEALELQKQEFSRKEDAFRKREEALKKKDLELQESLIRFSKFLQENDSKRARAEKKAGDEIKTRQAKEKEIEQLVDVLEQLRGEKEHVHEVLDKYMRYQRYLESVLEVADEYQEVQDLLLRHATLQATNNDLKEHQAACADAAEATRVDLQTYIKAKTDEILKLNNTLAQLKKELEAYEEAASLQETRKDHSLQVASQKTLEYGQVVMSTDNIFNRCKQRSSVAHQPETHPLAQLEVIGNYVSDLVAIIKQHKAEKAAAAGAAAVAASAVQ